LKTKCFHQQQILEKLHTNDGVTQAVQGIRAITPILQDSAHFENICFIYIKPLNMTNLLPKETWHLS